DNSTFNSSVNQIEERTNIFYDPSKHKTQIETRKSTEEGTRNYIRTQWVSEDFDAEDLKSSNISQPFTVVSPESTFIEKLLEERYQRRIVSKQLPIDNDVSSMPAQYLMLLESEIFHATYTSDSTPSELWNKFGQWIGFDK
ncbi:35562_t:CDS:2, partial [Racocetra persica]